VVGHTGFILGVDKQEITPLPYENVVTMTADVTQDGIVDEIQRLSGSGFDVVISDLSPNVSGVWEVDHARQVELARRALAVGRKMLRKSGNMLVKIFQGSELKEFQRDMQASFRAFRIVKPPASRPQSAELYFLGLGFVGDSSE
jgi:23S rRNA (uridine2552-2'-O)-methyltransferase